MSDKHRGGLEIVELKAGEATYEVAISMNAICDLEEEFDLGVNEVIQKFTSPATLRMTEVRRFLRVCLRDREGKAVSPDVADIICQAAGHKACGEAVSAALVAAFAPGA